MAQQNIYNEPLLNLRESMKEFCLFEKRIPQKLKRHGVWIDADRIATSIYKNKKSNEEISIDEYRHVVRFQNLSVTDCTSSIISPIVLCAEICKSQENSQKSFSALVNDMRFITERYTLLLLAARSAQENFRDLERFPRSGENGHNDLNDFHKIIREHLIKTSLDWRVAATKPFDEIEPDEISMKYKDPSEEDLATQVSFRISQSERPGSRAKKASMHHPGLDYFYYFCGEFAHPNIGDALSVQLHGSVKKAKDGALLSIRKISTDFPPNFEDNLLKYGDEEIVKNFLIFSRGVVSSLREVAAQLVDYLEKALLFNQLEIHKIVKKHKDVFHDRSDLCPCGSGRSIKVCAYSSSTRR